MLTDSLSDPLPTETAKEPQVRLSLLLPCYNEEAILERTLRRLLKALERLCHEFEILVIDDGSIDRTGEIAQGIAAEDSRVRVLYNERNLNYGFSLKRGLRAARYEWVLHNGADLPLAPEDLDQFIPHFEDADVIVARRTSRVAHSPWRKLTSFTHNRLVRLLFRPKTKDLNFVQFYRRRAVAPLALVSTSPAFVTPELILRAEKGGLRIREVTAEFRRREGGEAHFGKLHDILWTLRDMLKMRLRTWLRGWDPGALSPATDRVVPSIPLTRPFFDAAEESLVRETLRSGWVTQGPRVAELEELFADAVGARQAVAVSSGTAGLFLALHASGVGRGDEVIVPSLSFIATANSIVHCGATPVFVDVDPRTLNVDPDAVEAAITPRTRALVVVHQLGLPAHLQALQQIAHQNGLELIEDAACALGARYRNAPIGSSGNLVCFSFHPRKLVVTGEGGMITTNDCDLAARLRRLRHQGMSVSDLERHRSERVVIEDYPEIGYNFRLSDLHAALGVAQMGKLNGMVEERRRLGRRYDLELSRLPGVEVRSTPDYAWPNYQSYILSLSGAGRCRRDWLLDALKHRGIASRRGLMASHLEPAYQDARTCQPLTHTVAADAASFLLPIYNGLRDEDQTYVLVQLGYLLEELSAEGGLARRQ